MKKWIMINQELINTEKKTVKWENKAKSWFYEKKNQYKRQTAGNLKNR